MRTLPDIGAEQQTAASTPRWRTRRFLVVSLCVLAAAAGAVVVVSDDEGGNQTGTLTSGTTPPSVATTLPPSRATAPPATAPSTTAVTVAQAVPTGPVPDMVLASEQGVTVITSSGKPVRVSTAPAAIAFGIGSQYVVFQNTTPSDIYPPQVAPTVKVWSAGSVRDLPLARTTAFAHLLDARTVDGEAYALVSEKPLPVSPADAFEELVRIRLRDGARTVLVRRPSWESGHGAAQLLPGGEILGLLRVNAGAHLVRWSPGAAVPRWQTDSGFDGNFDLAVSADAATVVDQRLSRPGGTPVLVMTPHHPVTGAAGPARTVNVVNLGNLVQTGLHCTGWLTATELLCGHRSGPPIAVSVENGSYRAVAQEAGAVATVVRT